MHKKQFETEIRIRVKNVESLKRRLESMGAKLTSVKKYSDYQFTLESRNFWDSVEALRIRIVDGSEGGTLTYKPSGKKKQKYMQVREYETHIDNPEALMGMFRFLGIKPLEYVPLTRKTRYKYKLGDFNMDLDRYPKAGYFLDIELISQKKSRKDVERVKEMVKRLGFTEKDIQPTSVGFLLRELAIKANSGAEKKPDNYL
ncbi:MAG: class IV adenylate cyclase [Methanothrix sp.]|jgi:adenylate cyclase class 2